jgi:hypothetical protein
MIITGFQTRRILLNECTVNRFYKQTSEYSD